MKRTIYPAIKATLALPISLMVTALGTVGVTQQAQAFNLFGDRTTFQNQLDSFIVDDYENPGYLKGDYGDYPETDYHSDASMNSVLGETQYKATGWTFDGSHVIYEPFGNNQHGYCAGCNGSFLLDFTQTSVGSTRGVFGAAFDLLVGTNYFAHVIFGDNSQQDFSLASVGTGFWGITSDQKIKSIHLGLQGGGTTQNGYITIDNLTIGSNVNPESVPEPSSVLGVLALGALGVASVHKRKKAQVS
jgi:hypothetical protein